MNFPLLIKFVTYDDDLHIFTNINRQKCIYFNFCKLVKTFKNQPKSLIYQKDMVDKTIINRLFFIKIQLMFVFFNIDYIFQHSESSVSFIQSFFLVLKYSCFFI